jgi:hypothetical protein
LLLTRLLVFLSGDDLCCIGETSRRGAKLVAQQSLWRRLYLAKLSESDAQQDGKSQSKPLAAAMAIAAAKKGRNWRIGKQLLRRDKSRSIAYDNELASLSTVCSREVSSTPRAVLQGPRSHRLAAALPLSLHEGPLLALCPICVRVLLLRQCCISCHGWQA